MGSSLVKAELLRCSFDGKAAEGREDGLGGYVGGIGKMYWRGSVAEVLKATGHGGAV